MRLLNVRTLMFEEFLEAPPYVILSHLWENEEVVFKDLIEGKNYHHKKGYKKLFSFLRIAEHDYGINYAWVDCCCVNKAISSEIAEMITSLYDWFRDADICFIYLFDVDVATRDLASSRWFTLGWTLNDLVAPRKAIFFNNNWEVIGDKTDSRLMNQISAITGLSLDVLANKRGLAEAPVAERISWFRGRRTARVEDMAYCMAGALDILLTPSYGEGEAAMTRLWEAVVKRWEDYTMLLWTKPPELDDGLLRSWPRSLFPGPAFYSRKNSNCPDWPTLKRHSPVALDSCLLRCLPPFDRAPEGPQLTGRGLRVSLFAKRVRSVLVAWTYCTQDKAGSPGITYAVCVQVAPMDEIDDNRRYLRGALTGEVCYVVVDRLRGFELHDIYLPMEMPQPVIPTPCEDQS